jgi:hypothetical protein
MTRSTLEEHREVLEEAFYRDSDAMVTVRHEPEEDEIDNLATASGIPDTDLLAKLAQLGIRSDTLAALTLVPLIEVAWADGHMDDKEKSAVLAGAASVGIEEGSPSHSLLRRWVEEQPSPDLFKLWRQYIGALCQELGGQAVTRLRDAILDRSREVARAAGSFLGFGNNISPEEAAVLSELRDSFRR